MKMTDLFLQQLDKEAARTRRTLERVPEGRDDWKPHDKSMPLGRLAMLVAQMPSWIGMIVRQDELDVRPAAGSSNIDQRPLRTSRELVEAHDQGVKDARAALTGVTEDQLMKPWRLLAGGKVMNEELRHIVLRDTFMHLSHHRGQLTVYLRLSGQPVPAIYGPSADDQSFA